MKHLIIYGKPYSGKSTLCKLLGRYAGYTPLLTDDLTRTMRKAGMTALPTIMGVAMDTLKPGQYCHDRLYVHTLRQLVDSGADVAVVYLRDLVRRPFPARHADKLTAKVQRWEAQRGFVEAALAQLPSVEVLTVHNGPNGFDLSNLIESGWVPFECPVVLSPEDL